MTALFDNTTVLENYNAIERSNSGKAMSDNEGSALFHEFDESGLDERFGF